MSWVRSPLAAPIRPRRRGKYEPGWPNCRVRVTPQTHENAELSDATAVLAGLRPFVPRRGLGNGHLQTIVGNYLPRPPFPLRSIAETVEVDPADGSRVLCHCDWQPEAVCSARLTVILVHGLEGSSDSRYIQGIAARAWAEGCNVVRMNMRNCGDTDSSVADALSLRVVGRCGRCGSLLHARARAGASGAGGLLDGWEPGAEAGGGVGCTTTAVCCCCGVPGH